MQRGGEKFGKFSNALEKFRNLCWEVEVGKSKGNVPHLCLFHKDLHVRHGELIWVAYNAVQNMGWGDPTRTWPDCSCQSTSLINPINQHYGKRFICQTRLSPSPSNNISLSYLRVTSYHILENFKKVIRAQDCYILMATSMVLRMPDMKQRDLGSNPDSIQ